MNEEYGMSVESIMNRPTLIICALVILLSVIEGCGGEKKKLFMPDSVRWTDQDIPLGELDTGRVNTDSVITIDEMRKIFPISDSIIEGRPVSFYLNRADVSQIAKNFYLMRFIPSPDKPTFSICDSLLTKNDTTRPFYYFLFLRLNKVTGDETLSEGLLDYAKEYSFRFVDEFYRKLNMPQYKWSYSTWVENIDFMESNLFSNPEYVRQDIIKTQSKNAKKLTPELKREIHAFADSIVAHNARE